MDVESLTMGDPITTVLTVLVIAIIPFVLIVGTSFVKISVVLYILRNAIGASQVPPNSVIFGLAVLLSIFAMAPTAHQIYDTAAPALSLEEKSESTSHQAYIDAGKRATPIILDFYRQHANDSDVQMFAQLSATLCEENCEPLTKDHPLVLLSAFTISELTAAFAIGFILFLPFLVIDIVVANILLSLGMHMLSPTTVSLPFKLLLFVLVDGWALLARGLLLGYA